MFSSGVLQKYIHIDVCRKTRIESHVVQARNTKATQVY